MKVPIVFVDKIKISKGENLFRVGFISLFFNYVPYKYFEHLTIYFVLISILIMFIGIFIINKHTFNLKTMGQISFDDVKTTIEESDCIVEIKNVHYCIKFSKTGYKGKSNYIPFLIIGSLTENPGLNHIEFIQGNYRYEYDILIRNEN